MIFLKLIQYKIIQFLRIEMKLEVLQDFLMIKFVYLYFIIVLFLNQFLLKNIVFEWIFDC